MRAKEIASLVLDGNGWQSLVKILDRIANYGISKVYIPTRSLISYTLDKEFNVEAICILDRE